MAFLPSLLSCLALLLPSGKGTASEIPRVEVSSVLELDRYAIECDLIECPRNLPPRSEKLFERLDETALDEEDSIQVEDCGIIPSVLLDEKTTLAPLLSHRPETFSGRSPRQIASPILRC